MLKIVIYPNPVLRKKCEVVEIKDKKSLQDIDGLVKMLLATKNGVGLSAPQVGISKRFFAIKDEKKKTAKVYVNPEIVNTFGKSKKYFSYEKKDGESEPFLEGCLSIPQVYGQVARWPKIGISYEGLGGEGETEILEGYLAIVFQHELDHINGILFIDHVRQEKTQLYKDTGKELVQIKEI